MSSVSRCVLPYMQCLVLDLCVRKPLRWSCRDLPEDKDAGVPFAKQCTASMQLTNPDLFADGPPQVGLQPVGATWPPEGSVALHAAAGGSLQDRS